MDVLCEGVCPVRRCLSHNLSVPRERDKDARMPPMLKRWRLIDFNPGSTVWPEGRFSCDPPCRTPAAAEQACSRSSPSQAGGGCSVSRCLCGGSHVPVDSDGRPGFSQALLVRPARGDGLGKGWAPHTRTPRGPASRHPWASTLTFPAREL